MIKQLISRVTALCLGFSTLPSLAADFTLALEATNVVPTTRGAPNTTYFGWDTFEVPSGAYLDDTTPDLPSGGPVTEGVRFETTNGQLHRASSGNFYAGFSGAAVVAETVTVVTNGTPGTEGKTTIIAQLVGTGAFPSTWTFGSINDVAPVVVQGTNGAGLGQVWVKWVVDGNAPSYTFTIGAVSGQHMSFNKIEIDTVWSLEGAATDTMILAEPAAISHIMEQAANYVEPSSRGGANTTFFGWENFGVVGSPAVIDDSTPDIGSDSSGLARFRTANGQTHGNGGNLYFFSAGTLKEEVTVPTNGVVGEEGFTTIILQINSASGGMGGGAFAGDIMLDPIEDVTPTIVVGGSSVGTAFLWAKWEIPGNKATYTIKIEGEPLQAHYSFDRLVVDTKYSAYGYVGDTMRAKTIEVTTETLADAVKGSPYTAQLEATGGTTPHTWSLAGDTPLPAGLTLSSTGEISGTPTNLGSVTFTAIVRDEDDYQAEATYSLNVVSGITIVTASLPTPVVGVAYSTTLVATGGLAPLEWAVEIGDLPAGLELDAEDGVISGTPETAGEVTVTIKVTDDEESTVSKEFVFNISPTKLAPVMNPVVFAATTPGADFSHTVTATNYPDKFTITGLPKGLKYVANTGVISGKTTLPGVYLVQVKASNAGGTSAMVTAPLIVKALAPAIVGSFTGLVDRDASANGGLGSVFTLTTTSTGAFTLQVKSAATTSSVKGFLAGSAPQVSVNVGSSLLSLTLDPVTNLVTGTHGAADINGWRMVWDKKFNPAASREGYYSVALDLADEEDLEDDIIPHGVGYANFSVLSAGTLKITGKTADGQTLTAATTLGPDGQIAVYTPLYAKKGSVMGQWEIAEDAEGLFMENDVSGEMSWQKPLTKGRAYAAAFGPTDLAVEGGYLGYSARGPVALGLPDTGEISVTFAGGGVEASAVNPDVTGAKWTEAYAVNMTGAVNAGAVTLKVNKATGAVTGAFTLQETTPPLARKGVKFQGQVVRLSDGTVKAAGYFLLPQIPVGDQKATATPVLSGSFLLNQSLVP